MLHGVRVLEISSGIASAYCGKLLADAGAEVTVLEPPTGHALRQWRPCDDAKAGTLFEFLCERKHIVPADRSELSGSLLNTADVLIEDMSPGMVESFDVRRGRPRLIVVSLSPFGHEGPWRDRPASDFTLQAWCGSIGRRGLPGRPPVQAGGQITEWVAGAYAAAAAACYWWGIVHGGEGVHLDLSILESGVVALQPFLAIDAWFRGGPSPYDRAPSIPSVEPSADGFVGFSTITPQQFHDFLVMIERPDLAEDESLLRPEIRRSRRGELLEAIHTWTRSRATAEIVELATAFRIPAAPIGNGENLLQFDHFIQRHVFVKGPKGLPKPRVPYRVSSFDASIESSEDQAGLPEHGSRPRPAAASAGVGRLKGDAPLTGLKVVDFTGFWAGPAATHLLASLGADVVKIESVQHPDGMRFVSSRPDDDRWWEWGAVFHGVNANKRSITLDLGSKTGLQLAHKLIKWADVVIENFSPRVMEGFGLGWEEVSEQNPHATMVRMPAFGLSGPWRDRTGFAMTVEQASGLAWLTGYEDGPPMVAGGVCDPLGGMHAVVALMAALDGREETGHGCLVEVPLIEVALNVTSEQVLQFAACGVLLTRQGNRGSGAPQGVYRCLGEDEWVALTVVDDDQWERLRHAMGSPAWTENPSFQTTEGRREHHQLLDVEIERWCRSRQRDELAEELQSTGVPAAAVIRPVEVGSNVQLRARGFFEQLRHPLVGTYEVPSLPFQVAGRTAPWCRSPAPTLGAHNAEVLGDIAGVGEEELSRLKEEGVIGDRPQNRRTSHRKSPPQPSSSSS